MALGLYIFFMAVGTLMAGGSFALVVYYFDPLKIGVLAVAAFYVSLFLFLVGFFALIGLFIRRSAKKNDLIFKQVNISFRQAVWFSLIILFSLFLQAQRMWSALSMAAVILLFALLEFIFISHGSHRHA